MSGQLDRESIEVRYVLGDLSPKEEADFEERYFGNDEAFEELQVTEGELVDAYVHGELSAPERALLASQIARSPRLYERAEFASTLAKAISTRQLNLTHSVQPPAPATVSAFPKEISWRDFVKITSQKRPAFSRVLAGCAALVLIAGIAVIVQSIALRSERQRLENDRAATEKRQRELDHLNEEQRLRIAQLAAELKDEQGNSARATQLLEELRQSQKASAESGQHRMPAFASLTLLPGLVRGDGGQVFKISPGVSRVHLQIVLENGDHPRYEVVVRRPEGAEVFRQGELKARKAGSGPSLIVQIPTAHLPPGDYLVAVSGAISSAAYEHIRNYSFRVTTQTK